MDPKAIALFDFAIQQMVYSRGVFSEKVQNQIKNIVYVPFHGAELMKNKYCLTITLVLRVIVKQFSFENGQAAIGRTKKVHIQFLLSK